MQRQTKFPQPLVAYQEIVDHHKNVTNFLSTLDERVSVLLKEHNNDFMLSFKTYWSQCEKTLDKLKQKKDSEDAKTKEDKKIQKLESKLEWFMSEKARLEDLCERIKVEVGRTKIKAEALQEERRFLDGQIKGAKRQNKVLRAASNRARTSTSDALQFSGGSADANNEVEHTALMPPSPEVRRRPASASCNSRQGPPTSKMTLGKFSKTPEPSETLLRCGKHMTGHGKSMTRGHTCTLLPIATVSAPSNALVPCNPASPSPLGNEMEKRYMDAIQHMTESVARERNTVRMLQASRTAVYAKKSELEEFFLKCIHEARRDLDRKRHLTVHKRRDQKEELREAMLFNEDVLVCLYEQIFPHRTGIARSFCTLGIADDVRMEPSSVV